MASTAMTTVKDLNDLLERSKTQIARALPKHMTAERMMRVALTAFSKSPQLQKCTAISIAACVVQASELGLEMAGPLGQAYMVPRYNGKIRQLEATFQVGYRGFVDLAYRSGRVKTFCPQLVHENDEFNFQLGTNPFIEHRPAKGDRGPITYVYAICLQTNGGVDFEVMSREEVQAHAERYSDALKRDKKEKTAYSPWSTPEGWPEMARKTPLRKLAKRVPLSVELAQAAMIDETVDAGGTLDDDQPTITIDDEILSPPTGEEADEPTVVEPSKPEKLAEGEIPNEPTPEKHREPPAEKNPTPTGGDELADNLIEKINQATKTTQLDGIRGEWMRSKAALGTELTDKVKAVWDERYKAVKTKP